MTAAQEEPKLAATAPEAKADAKASNGSTSPHKRPAQEKEAAVKKAKLEPPRFVEGSDEFVSADSGWWAHKGGEWLYRDEEKTYFHVPTGQLFMTVDGQIVPMTLEAPPEASTAEAEENSPPARVRGRVKWFNAKKGFGFIEPVSDKIESKEDVFVHRNQLLGAGEDAFSALEAGTLVSFALGETDRGRVCAVEVQVEDDDDAAPAGDGAAEEGAEEGEDGGEDAESEGSSVEIDLFEELQTGLHQEKGPKKEKTEDFTSVKVQIPISVLGETATCVFFAVFDGHSGGSCAEYASTHLAKNILSRLRDRAKNFTDEAALKTALIGGFKQTEHNFLQHAKKASNTSGSTACTMTVFGPDEDMRLRLFMANVGDSRAVLGKGGGKAIRLTEDHKPDLPSEKKRIESNGGAVVEVAGIWRCMLPQKKWGASKGLSVSRTLGDVEFKVEGVVSAEPDIRIHEVDWDEDEFVIIGSDGIWDVITDKDAVRLVQRRLHNGASSEAAAKALVKRAQLKGSHDDCTALVVRFGWNKNSGRLAAGEEPADMEQEDQAAAEEAKKLDAARVAAEGVDMEGMDEDFDEEMEEEEDSDEGDNIFADGALEAGAAGSAAGGTAATSKAKPAGDDDDDDDDEEDDDKEKLGGTLPVTKPADDNGVGLFDGLEPPKEELMAPKLPALFGAGDGNSGKEQEPEAKATAQDAVDDDMDMFAS